MRYGIFSDIHSNLEALERVIDAYRSEDIDAYFCLGDVVGYGSDVAECISSVRKLCTATLAGNHDWASTGKFPAEYFNPLARIALVWTKRQLNPEMSSFLESLPLVYKTENFLLVHGTLKNPGSFNYLLYEDDARNDFSLLDLPLLFVGHSHLAGTFIEREDKSVFYSRQETIRLQRTRRYIVNVGSVGQPRDGDKRSSYCIYDSRAKTISLKRVAYDASLTRGKIIDAGLPHQLGDRLLEGR